MPAYQVWLVLRETAGLLCAAHCQMAQTQLKVADCIMTNDWI